MKNNICKTNEFDNAVYYTAVCGCGGGDCNQTLEIEKEDQVYLNIHTNLSTCHIWCCDNFFQRLLRKVKYSFLILFSGYVSVEESFIFKSEEQVRDYISALEEGLKHLEETNERMAERT